MKTINSVTILGYVATDIKNLSKEGSERKAVTFRVRTVNNFTTSKGEQKSEEDFHNIVAFEHFAEKVEKMCAKGSRVMINGRLRNRTYTKFDKDVNVTEVIVENISFIDVLNKLTRIETEEDKKSLFVDFNKPDLEEESIVENWFNEKTTATE